MPWLDRLRYRLRTATGRADLEQQLDEELQFHLEMQTAANVQLGMSPAVAHALARRQFGSVAQHKDDYRDRWLGRRFETVLEDLRGGVRYAWSQRGTSLAVIVALALGIGANTAVFSVFNAVVLNPLPYSESDRLVRLQAWGGPDEAERLFSAAEIRDLRARTRTLQQVAEFHLMYFILLDREEPLRASAGVVSANFFDVMGVTPIMGRVFTPQEERAGAPGVIVLSNRFWTTQLNADPRAVGRVFTMNDRTHTVVGVLPPLPTFPDEADIYLPTAACPLRMSADGDTSREMRLVSALGRIDSGHEADVRRVRSDLVNVASDLRRLHPSDYPAATALTLSAVPVQQALTERFRPTLSALVTSAVFLLLILCSSVGALMVASTLQRRRDITLRSALGAWPGRLLRQFATEAVVLTAAGAMAGLVLAHQALRPLTALAGQFTSLASEIQLDRIALLFTMALALVTSLVFGSLMAFFASPWRARGNARAADRSITTRTPIFKSLIVTQIAVSFALLAGAGLMLRTVFNLQRVDTGYDTRNVLTMRLSSDFIKYPTSAERTDVFDRVLRSIQALPAVDAAAVSGALPFAAAGNVIEDRLQLMGRVWRSRPGPLVSLQVVSADYFKTVGLTVLDGRSFDDGDRRGSSGVAVINQTMATRYWPTSSPIGQEVRVGNGEWLTVVGVVSDGRQRLERAPMDEVYRAMAQLSTSSKLSIVQPRLVVRSSVAIDVLEERVRDAVRRVDPHQPIDSVQTLDHARERSVAPARLTAVLLGLFAAIGVVISAVGVGGVVGSSVTARTREFGLQMALGATRARLLISVLNEGLRLAIGGLGLGLFLALLLSRVLRALLFEVPPIDVATFLGVAVLLTAITSAACVWPARRAASVDPNAALRAE